MNMATSKVLVTGAGGFIGSHLTERLVRAGARVRGLVHYRSSGSLGWLDTLPESIRSDLEIVRADIRDYHAVAAAMRGSDVVFHLAALIGIPYSYFAADAYVETNIKGTLNVLQAARALQTRRLVQMSTSEVYGTPEAVPIVETHPLQAQSPYAATKIGADQLARSFHQAFGTPVVIARPFNTYGPRQSPRAVIPAIIEQLASGATHIQIGATHPTRDFTFVDDTTAALVAAAETDEAIGDTVHFGSGYELGIGELARQIASQMGAPGVELVEEKARLRPPSSEVERLWANNAKAERLLGWKPLYTGADGLRRGLEQTIQWFTAPQRQRGTAAPDSEYRI
ncbi:SDR family NAD(P)-dependent oxidoreductase [Paenibacillus sp. IB182496]|uniref:SDR family NAD(P)-dependent oxidoreductase n=1 Tax=Paenibacillus sabuli TaxID=2772509 RepID=A0A927BS50_9BACL|nr:SDR family NAD(P)-dependent oxidoreductase [Paenibacillus sabuli]MBD2844509.1 SDR family NAD(P)-dependent oxidoreductase [Paenibacillus sabuli]